jgi:hypothetical protein
MIQVEIGKKKDAHTQDNQIVVEYECLDVDVDCLMRPSIDTLNMLYGDTCHENNDIAYVSTHLS